MGSNAVSYSSVKGLDPVSAAPLWLQTQVAKMRYDSETDLILANGSVNGPSATFATFDIPGDSLGQLNNIMPSIDSSGNNSVLNGFSLYTPGQATPQGTIVKYLFSTKASTVVYLAAVGGTAGTNIAYSYDSITWTPANISNQTFNGFATNNSTALALGSAPILYSTNGVTWTASSSAQAIFGSGVATAAAWNGSFWLAVGYNASSTICVKSDDGITWTSSGNLTTLITQRIVDIKYSNGLWVAGGVGANTVAYSMDGVAWYSSASGNMIVNAGSVTSILFSNNKWFMGVTGGNGTASLAISQDGKFWLPSTSAFEVLPSVSALASNGTLIVAVGNSVMYSNDEGVSWVASTRISTALPGETFSSVNWDGRSFVVGTSTGRTATSPDSIQWIPVPPTSFSAGKPISGFSVFNSSFGTVPCVEVQSTAPITLTANKTLYIKFAKTAMDSALTVFLQYVASLTGQGMLPNTTPGFQNQTYVNKNLLPSNITEGTTFTIGTTSITPVLRGVYNPATSYQLGDLVYYPDASGSLNMCLIGPDIRGPSYSAITGEEPVEDPFTSPYWNVIINRGWNTWTYDTTLDLALNAKYISTNYIFCDSNINVPASNIYPANLLLQLSNTALQGFTLFGSNVNQQTRISSFEYSLSSNGSALYALKLNKPPVGTSALYVKNGLANFITLNNFAFTNYLSLNLTSAASLAATAATQTSLDEVNSNAASLAVVTGAISTIMAQYPTQAIASVAYGITQQLSNCIQQYALGLQIYENEVALGNAVRIPQTRDNLLGITSTINAINTTVATAASYITMSDTFNASNSLSTMTNYTTSIATRNSYYNNIVTPTDIGYSIVTADNYVQVFAIPLSNLDLPGNFTIEWVTVNSQSNVDYNIMSSLFAQLGALNFVSSNGNLLNPFSSSSAFSVSGFSNPAATPPYLNYTIGLNQQNHLAWVRNGSSLKFYVNGYSVYSTSNTTAVTGSNLIIGTNLALIGTHWQGGLRNFRVDTTALYTSNFNTSPIITSLADSVFTSNLSPLSTTVACLPMNQAFIFNDFSPLHSAVSTIGPQMSSVALAYSTMITPFTQIPVGAGFMTIPPFPTNVAMTAWEYPQTSVTATWTASLNTTSYTVNFYYSTTNTTIGGTLLESMTVTGATATTTTAIANGLFIYALVCANNSVGSSIFVSTATAYVDQPPTDVEISPWTNGQTTMTATWTDAPNEITYTVAFYTNSTDSTSGGTLLQTIPGVTGTSRASSSPLVYGKYYYATVFGVTNVGVTTTTKSSNAVQFLAHPLNPATVSMTAVPANTNAITATWTASSYSQTYSVSFYSNPTNVRTGGTLLQTITGITGTTATTTATLTAAGFYYATVTGVNPSGSSSAVTATAATFYTPACGPVTNVVMSPFVPTTPSVTVTWTAAEFATSYIVQFFVNSTNTLVGAASFQLFSSVSGSATSQTTSSGLTEGMYYFANVQAVNANKFSATVGSTIIRVVTAPAVPTGVTMATWSVGTPTISVSWTAAARAATYTVSFYSVATNTTTGGTLAQTITDVSGTSCVNTNPLAPGLFYYALVASVNTTASSATATSSNTTFFNPVLAAPASISVSISSLTISSSWSPTPSTYGTPTYTIAYYTNTTGLQSGGTLVTTIAGVSTLTNATTFSNLAYRNFYYATVVGSIPGLSSVVTTATSSAYFLPTTFTPNLINNLSYWFDAADGTSLTTNGTEVTAWTNKGTLGGSATLNGTFPVSTLNSLTTVNFNFQQYMNIPSYTGSAIGTTMFFVMKATSNLVASTGYYPIVNGGGATLQIAASGSTVNYFQNNSAGVYTNSNTTSLSSFTQGFAILSSVENGTSTLPAGIWNNGSNVPFVSGSTSSSSTFANATLGSSYGWGMPFELAEVIIYTSNLPYSYRQAVEGYLAWKWGLQTSLPNNHPLKTYASGFFSPMTLPGLQMWLDATDPFATGQDIADGVAMTAWNDKSGKGRNATLQTSGSGTITSARAAINNLSAVYFNSPSGLGVRGFSSIPAGTFSSNYTAFTVYKLISLTGQEASFSLLSRAQTLYNQTGETRYVANTLVSDTTTNSNNWIVTSNLNLNMLTTYLNYPGGSNVAFSENLNGTPLSLVAANTFTAASGTITDTATVLSLTNTNGSGAYSYANMVYCEVLVFNSSLTTLQRQQVEGYLALKWGLQVQLPLYHPFKGSTAGFLNPTSAPGLTLWLDGSDPLANGSVPASGTLSTWYDKSGKGFHATVSGTPQYNSNTKAISFNGSQFYSCSYNGAHPTESAFIIVSFANPATTTNQYIFSAGNGTRSATLYSYQIYFGAHNGNNAAYINPTGASSNLPANTNVLFNYTYNNSAFPNVYSNGSIGVNFNTIFTPIADSVFGIGGAPGGGNGINGTISEIIIYNTALSSQDRQSIEGYLAWKWGLQTQLPAGHPYASQSTNLVYPNVNLTPSPPSLPISQFPGIQVWLDGADPLGTGAPAPADMTTWYDKSGLAQNAVLYNTQSTATGGRINASNTANGQGMVVPVSTAGRSLVPANTFINAISYFIVYKSLTNTGSEVPVSRGSQGNPWIGPFTTTFGGLAYVAGLDGIGTGYGIPSTYQPNTHISYLCVNQLSNTISYSLNGTATNVTGITPWAPSDPLNVLTFFDRVLGGNVNSPGSCQFNGIVHEILVFNRAFTAEQRMVMEGYLANRWKLQNLLPPIHSYKVIPPILGPTYEFTPECLPNLQLWLDGSDPLATGVSPRAGFFVNTWYDKSGKMNHAVGSNSPTLSSNGILFNGSNQCYVSPYTASSTAETGFIIVNMTSPVNNCPFITGTSSNTSRGFWGQINGAYAFALPNAAGSTLSYVNIGSANAYSTTYLLSYTYTNTGMTLNQNGTSVGSNTNNIVPALQLNTGSNPTIIGGSVNRNSTNGRISWMFGTISEVIIYNSVLSSMQRRDVEGYLAWKWGLNTNLPTAHPHYYQPPENSLTFPSVAIFPPQNLAVQSAWGTGLALSWTPSSNAEFYQFILAGSSITPGVHSISNASFSGLMSNTSYTIEVVAKNSYGSASSSITVSTTSNFSPGTFSGIQAWYDATDIMGNGTAIANGTAISTWYDKSGKARNFTATGSPVLRNSVQNSLPGIYLSGYTGQTAPMYYTSAIPVGTFASNMSWFAVYAHSTHCPNPIIVNRIITGTTWGNPFVYNGSNLYITGSNSGLGTPFTTSYNTQNFTPSLLNMNLTQSAATSFSGFTNGNAISFSGNGTLATGGDGGDTLILGTIANRFNAGFNGFFHEVIVYNTPLTVAQRQTVEGYLAWKWGLQNQLPPFHMYASAAPTSTTSLAGLPFLNTLPGLQLWLDAMDPLGTGTAPANGATLTYLADKSGNAYTTTFENRNSLVGVYYSGDALIATPTATYTAGTYPYITPMTSVATGIMSRIPSMTFVGATTVFIVYNSYANVPSPIFTRTITPTTGQVGNMGNHVDNQGTSFYIGSNNATTFNTGYTFYSPSRSIQNVNINQNAGTVSILSNALSRYSGTAAVTPSDGGNLFSLFSRGDLATGTLSANLNEAIVFNSVLTTSQTQLVEGYLAWKWGLESQLPAAHPYKSVSPTATATAPSFTPTSISGIQMWLDGKDPLGTGTAPANGTSITTWTDKSSAGNTATTVQGTVTYNSQGVSFTGAQYMRTNLNSLAATESAFCIVTFNNTVGEHDILSWNASGGLRAREYMFLSTMAINATNGVVAYSSSIPAVGAKGLYYYDYTSTAVNMYTNGVSNFSYYAGGWTFTPGTQETIIGSYGPAGGFLNGIIHEIVVYNSALPTADRQKVEGYLAWKWGLQSELPAAHPHKSASP